MWESFFSKKIFLKVNARYVLTLLTVVLSSVDLLMFDYLTTCRPKPRRSTDGVRPTRSRRHTRDSGQSGTKQFTFLEEIWPSLPQSGFIENCTKSLKCVGHYVQQGSVNVPRRANLHFGSFSIKRVYLKGVHSGVYLFSQWYFTGS